MRLLHVFSLRPMWFHLVGSVVLCAVVAGALHLILNAGQRQVVKRQQDLEEMASQLRADGLAPRESEADARPTSTWPGRTSVDALAQAMSEQAIVNGLVLRTLSVSHAVPAERAWGRVRLELVASGRYADLKNWQAGLLARFPSLALQSLRLQPVVGEPVLMGGVEAQMVWVLYVRD